MNEVIPVRPVMEVRETFTLSEQLRDALVNFLDPELDQKTRESLRAAFLFKSWYRRLLDKDQYNFYERDRNGYVDQATREFADLPDKPILFNGQVDMLDSRIGSVRIVLHPRQSGLVSVSHNILSAIPSIERLPVGAETDNRLYVEIAKQSLASSVRLSAARFALQQKTINPTETRRYYVEPGQVVVRQVVAAIPLPRDRDGY